MANLIQVTLNLQPRRFTVEEYARMGEAGVFPPGERVELLEGEIYPMSPHNFPHSHRLEQLTTLLVLTFHKTHGIRVQLPLTLNPQSEPEPDFALVPLNLKKVGTRHPHSADLVIEVADSSLSFDRGPKASAYARAGIAEYWLLNLQANRVEVRRQPAESQEATYGWTYATLHLLAPGQSLSPLFAPEVSFTVEQLLGLDEG